MFTFAVFIASFRHFRSFLWASYYNASVFFVCVWVGCIWRSGKMAVALNNIFRWQYYWSGYVTLIFNRFHNHFFPRPLYCELLKWVCSVVFQWRMIACREPFNTSSFMHKWMFVVCVFSTLCVWVRYASALIRRFTFTNRYNPPIFIPFPNIFCVFPLLRNLFTFFVVFGLFCFWGAV